MTLKTEHFVINIGPQHPSTHGVFRLRPTLDGEGIVDVEPVLGYLHRGIEKLAEGRNYAQNIPFTDRLDYLAAMTNNQAYCMAVEKLAGIPFPSGRNTCGSLWPNCSALPATWPASAFILTTWVPL